MFATIGTYGITQSPVDLILLYLIGGIGYLMRRYDFPAAPVIIGMNDGSARRIKATYDFAVQTHATIGPSCAVADFQGGKLTVWTSSQATHSMQHELAVITGLSREAIRLVFIEQQPAQANAAIEADQEFLATQCRPGTPGTQTPLRCRPGPRADLSRGRRAVTAGQRADVDSQPCIVEIPMAQPTSAISPPSAAAC